MKRAVKPAEPSPAVRKAMAAFKKRLAEIKRNRVMPLSEMDTLTKSVICAARWYITAKNPASALPYLKKAVARFEKAHEREMMDNLLRAVFGKKGGKK
jgi:hypothetical protein